jgi:hypothetical protein
MSGPGTWRALWFTKYLAEWGYAVTVLCGTRSKWCHRYDKSLLQVLPVTVRVRRIKSAFQYRMFSKFSCRFIVGVRKAIARRIERYYPEPDEYFLWAIKATIISIILVLSRRIDCVITSGPPHMSHIVGWFTKKVARKPWIMDYRDLWTDDPIQSPQRGYQKSLFVAMERKAVASADAIVTVSPFWQHHLRAKFRGEKRGDNFFLIRNGHNLSREIADKSVPRHYGERLHVHFNGTPQSFNLSKSFLEALTRLKSATSSDHSIPIFTFTGFDGFFSSEVQSRCLEDIVIDVGVMSHQQCIEYCLGCDVLLVIVTNDAPPLHRGTIPAKIYEAIALRRHILAIVPTNSDVIEILEEYGNATVCNVDNPDDIYRGLIRLATDWTENKINGVLDVQKMEAILWKYHRKNEANQLNAIIENLLAKRN